jgi:hypothetical protein
MKKIAIHARNRNHYLHRQLQLDLFAWRPTPPWNDNRAAQYVMRRYHVAPHTAVVIAALAGFGGSEER